MLEARQAKALGEPKARAKRSSQPCGHKSVARNVPSRRLFSTSFPDLERAAFISSASSNYTLSGCENNCHVCLAEALPSHRQISSNLRTLEFQF